MKLLCLHLSSQSRAWPPCPPHPCSVSKNEILIKSLFCVNSLGFPSCTRQLSCTHLPPLLIASFQLSGPSWDPLQFQKWGLLCSRYSTSWIGSSSFSKVNFNVGCSFLCGVGLASTRHFSIPQARRAHLHCCPFHLSPSSETVPHPPCS